MGFRFRRRTRLFPGVSLNWSKNGLSSISLGGPGATTNVPVARDGGTRSTVGLPGTGLSYSHQESVRQRQERQRQATQLPLPSIELTLPTTEATIAQVMEVMVGPDCVGDAFWNQGLLQRVLDYEDTPRKVREAAFVIRSPESVELHLRRARGRAATVTAAQQICRATAAVLEFTEAQGWSESVD